MSVEWNQTVSFLQEQGPVFWAAAAAVAAGIALLAGAAILQVRRLRNRPARPEARVRLTETGYAAHAPLPVPAAAPAPDPRLEELRDRLAAAAARLETVRAARAAASGLKTSPKRVEYVHRSGHA